MTDLRQPPRTTGGWLLVSLIVLISAALLGLGGMTLLLTSHLKNVSLRQNYTKAAYLAHAGYMQAVYDFRIDDATAGTDNCYTFGEYAVPADQGTAGKADDDVFVLGGNAADVLLVNMIPSTYDVVDLFNPGTHNRDRYRAWTVQNVLCGNAPPVTITHLTITWNTAVVAGGVLRVDIPQGTSVWQSTPYNSGAVGAPSGTVLDITDVTIPGNTTRTGAIYFSTTSQISNARPIQFDFRMSDQTDATPGSPGWSTRVATDATTPGATSGSFTVKSQGIVRRGAFPFPVWRRFQQEYRLNDADISTNRQEPGNRNADPWPESYRPAIRELTWTAP